VKVVGKQGVRLLYGTQVKNMANQKPYTFPKSDWPEFLQLFCITDILLTPQPIFIQAIQMNHPEE